MAENGSEAFARIKAALYDGKVGSLTIDGVDVSWKVAADSPLIISQPTDECPWPRVTVTFVVDELDVQFSRPVESGRESPDPEQFCPYCLAGVQSMEHFRNCF